MYRLSWMRRFPSYLHDELTTANGTNAARIFPFAQAYKLDRNIPCQLYNFLVYEKNIYLFIFPHWILIVWDSHMKVCLVCFHIRKCGNVSGQAILPRVVISLSNRHHHYYHRQFSWRKARQQRTTQKNICNGNSFFVSEFSCVRLYLFISKNGIFYDKSRQKIQSVISIHNNNNKNSIHHHHHCYHHNKKLTAVFENGTCNSNFLSVGAAKSIHIHSNFFFLFTNM